MKHKRKITKAERKRIISWLILASGLFLICNSLRDMLNLSPSVGVILGIIILVGGARFFEI